MGDLFGNNTKSQGEISEHGSVSHGIFEELVLTHEELQVAWSKSDHL
jgi:hypothetical protein